MRLSALLLAAFAPAAPFGEQPFRPVEQAATCLRATGVPGELLRTTDAPLADAGIELLQGTAMTTSFSVDARIASCPSVATRPSGAGVLAFLGAGDNGVAVRSFVREGGRWAPAGAIFDPSQGTSPEFSLGTQPDLATAVSDGGEALVVAGVPSLGGARVLAFRRAPGGTFGAPVPVFSAASSASVAPSVAAGMSAAGEAIVAWAAQPRSSTRPRELWAAVAPPGGAFGTPQRLGELRPHSPFDLAVAGDGRALLAFPSGNDVRVAERAPGGAFGATAIVGHADDPYAVLPAAALRADGGAVVFWSETFRGRARAVTRTAPGPFGAATTLAPRNGIAYAGLAALLDTAELLLGAGTEFGASGAEPDEEAGNPRATYLPDGRPLITWAGIAEREGVWSLAPHVAVADGAQPLGADVRDSSSITPLVLADGRAAVAWTDNDGDQQRGRIHLAVEGATEAADPAPPRVTVKGPSVPLLDASSKLPLRVTCSAACDVRLQATSSFDAMTTVSLTRAGSKTVTIEPGLRPLAPLRTGPVKVIARYAAPGARHGSSRTFTLQLRRRPSPPVPRVLGLRARRTGSRVVVSFQTDRLADPDDLLVVGHAADGRMIALEDIEGEDATRFTVTFDQARAVAQVTVLVGAAFAASERRTTVRVR